MTTQPFKVSIALFGATGDLSRRKLLPSIFHLFQEGSLKDDFALIAVGRRDITDDDFREVARKAISENDKLETLEGLELFLEHVHYVKLSITESDTYSSLKDKFEDIEGTLDTGGNRLFYLAMPPQYFTDITDNLRISGITETEGSKKLIIEKPFGKDYDSAYKLNEEISKSFKEHEIYRIDHYLGKEMVQNIEVIRFSNSLFEPLWNNHYVSNVQITSSESLGVLDRAEYYERSGAVRDMFQNHMLQVVSLLGMEPPVSLNSNDIREEKIKVLKSLRKVEEQDIRKYFVRGQYDEGVADGEYVRSYREEENVSENSNTPTFIAARLFIDNFRWAGVPFYVRTGKRMKNKETKIVVEFREVPMNLYYQNESDDLLAKNLLVIRIQPNESITLHLNVKDYAGEQDTKEIKMSYSVDPTDLSRTVDAYENLIYDCLSGDATNFTHYEELMNAWSFVDPVNAVWESELASFPNYRSGSNGPVKSSLLLSKDGFKWWDV
ncbi:glucose-6-phosphate dehydrogenase [Salinicoccus hispanicus]|uniref:Glucose-6-phosphate 1-dehydrogenase n=1 Tax=Salinicoccus hispanicus TaxID=157225 RepID=A0A6N8U269_9STAP|nr:glucose-6-phosphate dehydrogenase [Salinicoccus hispanicus]MXQ50241.1 glucose-6-phosphate dehydrogenase [Salinicoccus hispanicus]